MKNRNLIAVVSFGAFLLHGCGNEGGAKIPLPERSERLSSAARCLRAQPELQVRTFLKGAEAARAFFKATAACGPSEQEMLAQVAWMEARGATTSLAEEAR